MKITIFAPEPPYTRGNEIRLNDTQKRLNNSRNNMFPNDFDDDEIFYIIGEKNYEKLEKGKFEFDIPLWKLNTIQGINNPTTREQLIYSNNWDNLNN